MADKNTMFVYTLKNRLSAVLDKMVGLDKFVRVKNGRYVLAYHRVLNDVEVDSTFVQSAMWVSVENFKRQLEWMSEVGSIVSLDRITDFAEDNDRPLFAITFDDGWIDNYTRAWPVLAEHNVPATVFLATQAVETGETFWVESFFNFVNTSIKRGKSNQIRQFLSTSSYGAMETWAAVELLVEDFKELPQQQREQAVEEFKAAVDDVASINMKREVMNWDEIREMRAAGIDFQSHTHTHRILKGSNNKLIQEELRLSKEIIEKNIGGKINTLCYPNARFPDDMAAQLEAAGYRRAFKIDNERVTEKSKQAYLPRYLVSQDTSLNLSYLKCRFLGLPGF